MWNDAERCVGARGRAIVRVDPQMTSFSFGRAFAYFLNTLHQQHFLKDVS